MLVRNLIASLGSFSKNSLGRLGHRMESKIFKVSIFGDTVKHLKELIENKIFTRSCPDVRLLGLLSLP